MADTTAPVAARPKPSAVPQNAEMAAYIAEALRQANASRFGPAAAKPTQRVRDVAALIIAGKPVEVAMTAVTPPYGRKFIAGNAATFPAFLAGLGLLSEAQARKAAGAVMTKPTLGEGDDE